MINPCALAWSFCRHAHCCSFPLNHSQSQGLWGHQTPDGVGVSVALFVAVMVCNTPSSNCLLSTLLTNPISLSHLHLCLCPHCEQEGLLSQLCWLILVVMVGNDNNLISNPHSILAHNSHLTVLPVATHIVSMRGFSHSFAGLWQISLCHTPMMQSFGM